MHIRWCLAVWMYLVFQSASLQRRESKWVAEPWLGGWCAGRDTSGGRETPPAPFLHLSMGTQTGSFALILSEFHLYHIQKKRDENYRNHSPNLILWFLFIFKCTHLKIKKKTNNTQKSASYLECSSVLPLLYLLPLSQTPKSGTR